MPRVLAVQGHLNSVVGGQNASITYLESLKHWAPGPGEAFMVVAVFKMKPIDRVIKVSCLSLSSVVGTILVLDTIAHAYTH